MKTLKVYQFFSYLKFLVSSTNQHGVHSPFVYSLLTKGLYQKRNKNYSISEHVLTKAISYFKYKRIGFVHTDDYIKRKIVALFEDLEFNSLPFDLIYAEKNDKLFNSISPESYHNNTMILLKGMHKTKARTENWERIKKLPEVTVTIDLFYCSLVFFRKEQAKEHFKIRI